MLTGLNLELGAGVWFAHGAKPGQGTARKLGVEVPARQLAAQGQDTAVCAIEPLVKLRHGAWLMGQQGLFLPQDWLAVGMVSAAQFEELLEGHFIGLVFALGQFLKHHLALHGEGIAFELGLKHELEEELQRF